MNDTAELWATVTTTATGVLLLVGAAVRYVLLPWLREHLITPLLDRLTELAATVTTLGTGLEGTARDVRVAARMFEGHIDASEQDRARLWDAVAELRELITPRHRRRRTRREDHR